jgi:hypothetical protein
MSIKKVFIITIIIGLLIPFVTAAQVRISEIMYDPAGTDTKREWIEVFNSGTTNVDLATYFFLENGVYHKLVAQASSVLVPGAFAIIADSVPEVLVDHPGFAGLIFDSAFSLGNVGESLVIANALKETVNSFTYAADMGASGDGNSLQITDGQVVTAGPTFGTLNKTVSEIPVDDSDADSQAGTGSSTDSTTGSSGSTGTSSSNPSSHSEQVAATTYTPTATFKLGAGRTRTTLINTPIEFEAHVSKQDSSPRYVWNFGDLETDTGRKTSHVYMYPGTYQVVLRAKSGEYEAISRTEVVVHEPDLALESATTTISITNRLKKEVNIGGFMLNFMFGSRRIPDNTILKGGHTITISRDPDEILESIEYPNGRSYARFDHLAEYRFQLAAHCDQETVPIVCKDEKVKRFLVQ